MAKINTRALKTAPADGSRVTIGNNRQVQKRADETIYRLHGHPVVRVTADTLTVDTCGYSTVTTRNAIRDFIEAHLGFRVGVSFARGDFALSIPALGYDATVAGNMHEVRL